MSDKDTKSTFNKKNAKPSGSTAAKQTVTSKPKSKSLPNKPKGRIIQAERTIGKKKDK